MPSSARFDGILLFTLGAIATIAPLFSSIWGVPIVGDPDHVAEELARLSRGGLRGIGISLVNYLDELPYFCAEVLPRLERLGLRQPACRS